MVTNENQRKFRLIYYPETDKSWIDYRVLTKIGLSDNTDGPPTFIENKGSKFTGISLFFIGRY